MTSRRVENQTASAQEFVRKNGDAILSRREFLKLTILLGLGWPLADALLSLGIRLPGAAETAEAAPKLVNPYFDYVFNQRCSIWEEAGKWQYDCIEPWAELPLRGETSGPLKAILGQVTCNTTSTAYVINKLAPAEVIQKVIGMPGLDPEVLVRGVYENLPDGQGFKMGWTGVGFEKIFPTLETFGLKVTNADKLSWWTLARVVRKLKPGQVLMVAMLGTNARGRPFQHYTVVNGVDEDGRVCFNDSFFFEDAKRAEVDQEYRHHVYFEDSPNIMDDSSSPIGKRVDIVAAAIVEAGDFSKVKKLIDAKLIFREGVAGLDYQREFVVGRREYIEGSRGLTGTAKFLETPVAIGPDRYRVNVGYAGKESLYYFFDPDGGGDLPDLNKLIWYRWKNYMIPLFKQTDPEWAGLPILKKSVDGVTYQFGRKGCGQAVTASLLSMMKVRGKPKFINPYEVYQKYFPNLSGGIGTSSGDYKKIFQGAGFQFEWLKETPKAITKAADQGKLVAIQGDVDFKNGGKNEGRVGHFVLVLGRGLDGRLQIFDPIWGVGVTELDDIDFSQSSGVMALSLP